MAGGLPPPPIRAANGDFAWTAWYNQLYALLSTTGSVSWSLVNKAGSSIADLANHSHNLLTSIQGGTAGQYYHLTSAEHTYVQTAMGGGGGGGGSGSSSMIILEGNDGEEGQVVPGPRGATGLTGNTGPSGPPGFGNDGEDGLDGFPVPGPIGAPGVQGATGPSGPAGFGVDGEDGLDSMTPGPIGPQGPQGIQGTTGLQGLPGVSANFVADDLSEDIASVVLSQHFNGGVIGSTTVLGPLAVNNQLIPASIVNPGGALVINALGDGVNETVTVNANNGGSINLYNNAVLAAKWSAGAGGLSTGFTSSTNTGFTLTSTGSSRPDVIRFFSFGNEYARLFSTGNLVVGLNPVDDGAATLQVRGSLHVDGPITAGSYGGPIPLDGEDGLDGMGIPGPVGPTGASGLTGSTGAQGPSGPAVYLEADVIEPDMFLVQGNQGTQGVQGNAGLTGSQGPIGPAVFLEADGLEGEIGPPGPQGLQGIAGTAGATGPQGPIGFGIDGDDGLDGHTVIGPQGLQGIQGVAGTSGVTAFPIALDGADGDDGMPIPGNPGQTGQTGSQGPTGPAIYLEADGLDGDIGPPGPQGPTGTNGTNGTNGSIGPQGPAGPAIYLEVEAAEPEWLIAPTSINAGSSMVYPGVGIANSTGTAWGTSYSVSGTGTVIPTTGSPTITTPTFSNGLVITGTAGNPLNAIVIAGSTSGYAAITASNNSGGIFFGLEGSIAGGIITGSTAYGTVLRSSQPIYISTVPSGNSTQVSIATTGMQVNVPFTAPNLASPGAHFAQNPLDDLDIEGMVLSHTPQINPNVLQPKGGGSDAVFYENDQTITTNYTLTTGKNAMSAGPITINTGVTVTVPTGATWSVI